MSEYCIELKNVTKKFGKFTAVDDVSIRLEPGKVYGFVGPNGAGKSTTMAMIMRMNTATITRMPITIITDAIWRISRRFSVQGT